VTDKWSPFDEAEFQLDQYDHFFPRGIVAKAFDNHPQLLEDWLGENCPDNYCYVWVYSAPDSSRHLRIVGDLIGTPKDVALALKLITSVDILHRDSFIITKRYGGYGGESRDSYRVEQLQDSKIF